jgi:hypothetical protein
MSDQEMQPLEEHIKQKMRSVMKHFNLAINDAIAEGGTPTLSINSENEDGSGKRIMSFNCVEFFADLAILVDAEPDTEEDKIEAKAQAFVSKFKLKLYEGSDEK